MTGSFTTDKVRLFLKDRHFSWTKPRQRIFEQLQRRPATLPDLVDSLRHEVDQATVYRTVTLFEELGIAHRIWAGWKSVIELTDSFSPHHHHLVCEKCDRLIDFEDRAFETALTALARRQDFRVSRHHVELFGLCRQCQLTA